MQATKLKAVKQAAKSEAAASKVAKLKVAASKAARLKVAASKAARHKAAKQVVKHVLLPCVICLALAFAFEVFFFNFQFWNTLGVSPIEVSSENAQLESGVSAINTQGGEHHNQLETSTSSTQNTQGNSQSAQIDTQGTDTSSAQGTEIKQGILSQNGDTFSTSMYVELDSDLKQQEAIHNPERKQLITKDKALDVGIYTRAQNASSVLEDDDIAKEEASPNKRCFTFSIDNTQTDLQTLWLSYSTEEQISLEIELRDGGHALYQSQGTIGLGRTSGTANTTNGQLICLHPVGKASSVRIYVDAMRSYSLDMAFNKPATLSIDLGRAFAFAFAFLLIFALRPKSSLRLNSGSRQKSDSRFSNPRQNSGSRFSNSCQKSNSRFSNLRPLNSHPINLRSIPAKREHYFIFGAAACIFAFGFAYINSLNLIVDATAESQYADLAKALANGQFFLNDSPPAQLEQISNPYDNALRDALGISARWDCAYFQGHYYVYFGVLPVLLMHLPFYLLTGGALPNWIAVACFSSIFIAGLLYLISRIAKMFNKHISLAALLLTFCACLAISVIQNALHYPAIYVVCITCAMALCVWGISFWVKAIAPINTASASVAHAASANMANTASTGVANTASVNMTNAAGIDTINEKPHIHVGWVFAGSACMAATVLARPTFLIYSLFGVVIFVAACMRYRQTFSNKNNLDEHHISSSASTSLKTKSSAAGIIVSLLVAIVPYLLFLGFAAFYNNARFVNPLDFGAAYNLTSNDLVHRGFDMQRSISGVFVYLLQLPSYQLNFPYLATTYAAQGYVGTLSVERSVGGLFMLFSILLSFIFVFSKNVRQRFVPAQKDAVFGVVFAIIVGIVIAFVLAFFDANAAGIMERYYMDFGLALAISLSVFLIALLPSKPQKILEEHVEKKLEGEQLKKAQIQLQEQAEWQSTKEPQQRPSALSYFIWITFGITVLNALLMTGASTSVFA